MHIRHTYTWILSFIWLCTHLTAQEAELRYRLLPGQTYTLEIELDQRTHSESAGSDEVTLFSQMKIDFYVDSVNQRGTIFMVAGYRDLLLSMLAPSMDMDINSASGRDRMLTQMMDSLEQRKFRLVMHPSGELESFDEISPVIRAFAAGRDANADQHGLVLNTMDEVYGTHAFHSLFHLFVSVYPVVQPIKNWTRDLIYYFNTKPVQMVNRFYLTKTTEKVITIQGLGMLNSTGDLHEKDSRREISSRVSGSQTYDFQMDAETGWLKQCVSRQRLVIETTIIRDPRLPSGLRIPSYTETLFEVKGTHTGNKTAPDD